MIKEKLKRGTLLYKLYLYYHLYVRYKFLYKKRSYSQFQEDLFLLDFFKNRSTGKFVDLGAYHPMKFNNTYLLYKKGWSGTNVDLNSSSIDMFNIVRERDTNKCALISAERNIEKTVYYEHNFSAVNSLILSEDLKKVLKKEKIMKTSTFDELVDHKFDFLNIDLEGHDYDVLKTINLQKHKPDLICIEILENCRDKEKIYSYLKLNNYEFIKKCKISYFFRRVF